MDAYVVALAQAVAELKAAEAAEKEVSDAQGALNRQAHALQFRIKGLRELVALLNERVSGDTPEEVPL